MVSPPRTVTSEMVAAYLGMCEAHAARFTRIPFMQADYDDFVQEGLIGVWQALAAGEYPSNIVVTNRMRDWARKRSRQLELLSPLDEEELAA